MKPDAAARARLRCWRKVREAAERVAATDLSPPAIIDAMRGMGADAWIEFDERSGYRDFPDVFGRVRQVRNSPMYGPALIRAVNERVRGR